jgi:hypothetical protein
VENFSKSIKFLEILFKIFQNDLEHSIAQARSVMRTRRHVQGCARPDEFWHATRRQFFKILWKIFQNIVENFSKSFKVLWKMFQILWKIF